MHYEAPTVEVLQLENEGVIASSTEQLNPVQQSSVALPDAMPSTASSNDLEDMINEIFTIEN